MTDNSPPSTDPWYKKTISHRIHSRVLSFRVSQALFSSHEIDGGTRLLLRSIAASPLHDVPSVLDLGCGYGVIGVTLATAHPRERLHMVDRDALAVAFARENATANGIKYATAYSSLGYDDVTETFDLIAMNIPGKAGEAVIRHLLRGAYRCLAPGGAVAAVAVAPLAPLLASALRDDAAIEVTYERTTPEYVVVHYRFVSPPDPLEPANAFDVGIYTRAHPHVNAVAGGFDLTTVVGLPEFDRPSFGTQLLLAELAASPRPRKINAAVLNPGQGHAAVLLHRVANPAHVTLAGRDLLALRATAANLADNGRDPATTNVVHGVGMLATDAPFDLVVATIDDEDPIDASAHVVGEAAAALATSGTLLVATTSTTSVRLAKRIGGHDVRIVERTRRRGAAILAVTLGTGQV